MKHGKNRQRSERKTREKIIDGLRIKAAKTDNPYEQINLINEISKKEAELTEIATLPVLFINDATPESLTTIMHEQQGRLGIFSDEGGILETLAGLYNNGLANVDILLKGIVMAEKYAYDAKIAASQSTHLLQLF